MIVFGSPSRYIQGAGILSRLGQEVVAFGDTAALVVDPLVQARYGAQMAESCMRAGIRLFAFPFGGECTDAEVERLAGLMTSPRMIIAAGGGKCLDIGKALSHRLGLPMISIPTAASTDAPVSHNYVMYDSDHTLLEVRRLARNPAQVIVDTQVIAEAPRHLFVAGVGDAIGKIYEVEACVNAKGRNIFSARPALSALALARASHAILLENTDRALAAIERRQPDDAFDAVVEATILMSGLAFESGGLSLAHSMTRGLSRVARYAGTLHGFQVAYATLIQVYLERRPDTEFRALIDFYARCGLPCSLAELGGSPGHDDIRNIAAGTMTSPHINHFPHRLSVEEISDAMNWLEHRGIAA